MSKAAEKAYEERSKAPVVIDAIKRFPQLTDNAFTQWETSLKDYLYSVQLQKVFEESLEDKPDKIAIPDVARIDLWALIRNRLPSHIRDRTMHVPNGEVELLIRTIRHCYYDNSRDTQRTILGRLHAAHLTSGEHETLDNYLSFMDQQRRILKNCGYDMPDEQLLHYICQGLPTEYDVVVENINLPNNNVTYSQALQMLQNFAKRKNVPGSISYKQAPRLDAVHQITDRREPCRNFRRGTGYRSAAQCRYSHENASLKNGSHDEARATSNQPDPKSPPRCFYCDEPGHSVKTCPKIARMEKLLAEKSKKPDIAAATADTRPFPDGLRRL